MEPNSKVFFSDWESMINNKSTSSSQEEDDDWCCESPSSVASSFSSRYGPPSKYSYFPQLTMKRPCGDSKERMLVHRRHGSGSGNSFALQRKGLREQGTHSNGRQRKKRQSKRIKVVAASIDLQPRDTCVLFHQQESKKSSSLETIWENATSLDNIANVDSNSSNTQSTSRYHSNPLTRINTMNSFQKYNNANIVATEDDAFL